jgi:FkbH-like protein
MVLKRNDIAASRINWRSKSANIREIAMELNLGLDAFVFIDDDPANRSEVKAGVPLVHVVPMPQEAAAYVQTLGRLWLFDQGAVTAVDRDRTAMMQQEQRRRSAKDAA